MSGQRAPTFLRERLSPEEELLLAYHEAGHALGGLLTGRGVGLVTIRPLSARTNGMCVFRPVTPEIRDDGYLKRLQCALGISDESWRSYRTQEFRQRARWREQRRALVRSLAGPLAEAIASGILGMRSAHAVEGWSGDLEEIYDALVPRFSGGPTWLYADARRVVARRNRYFNAAALAVSSELRRPATWRAVEALAHALVRDGTLSGRRAKRIIRKALRGEPPIRARWPDPKQSPTVITARAA